MTRKVKFGVYERRVPQGRRGNQVTVTHIGIYINKLGGEYERGVLYHTFNEPNHFTQAMSESDFLKTFSYVGKLFTIHTTEEQVR